MMLVDRRRRHTAAPGVSGGYLINQHEVQNRIEALRAVVVRPGAASTQVRPMWLNVNDTEREHSGLTYEDISKLIASLTKSDTASIGDDPFAETLSTEPVFDAAFAGSLLEHLPAGTRPRRQPSRVQR